jgi:hypothetical protein
VSSDSYAGSFSARIPAGGYIRARVRIAEPALYEMLARYKRGTTATTGTIQVQVSVVGVDYVAAIPEGGCPTLNDYTESATIQYPLNTTRTPSATWQSMSPDLATITGGAEGIRGSIWVINNTSGYIYVDDVALDRR